MHYTETFEALTVDVEDSVYLINDGVIPIHIVVSPAVVTGGRDIGAIFGVHFTFLQATHLSVQGYAFVDQTAIRYGAVMCRCAT